MADFSKAVYALEYDKIRTELSGFASTRESKALCLEMMPSGEFEEVANQLALTDDAVYCISDKGTPPFGSVRDIGDILGKAIKGAVLSPGELMSLREILYISQRLKEYFTGLDDEGHEKLAEIFSRLSGNKYLTDKTAAIIIGEDRIADTASPALGDIRRKIRNANNRIKDDLAKYTSGAFSKYLQDNIVTIRGGRYVIPVKQEYRGEIKGMVHDTSASGSTFFIEPMSIVDLNNKIKELEIEEEREIERILSALTSEYLEQRDILKYDFENITELAFIFAKASYSESHRCQKPIITKEKKISLKKARHPLLDNNTVVPIDIAIGGEYDTLVITGPNTGGKTVSLKTLGLCAMMAQSGLFIPASPDSTICVFTEILADIGDEQSIEQSLSTFSAHMVNAVDILSVCGSGSLVLFDELGAGTDPVEGAALATSILEYVRRRGALSAATTHYSELKAYAFDTDGVVNASCEFDVETLRPTYRLVTGTPGRSNAFAICEKLGVPSEVITGADKLISEDARKFENVIRQMEDKRESYEKSSDEAVRLREEAEEKLEHAEKVLAEAKEKANKITKDAAAKADSVIRGAQASSEYIFKELEKLKKKSSSDNFAEYYNEQRQKLRKALRRAEGRASKKTDIEPDVTLTEEELNKPFEKGDTVIISGVGIRGVIEEGPDDRGNVVVKNGSFSTRTNINKLIHAAPDAKTENKKKGISSYKHISKVSVPMEIDLRGENSDDGWQRLDKYLDDVKLAGYHTVTVIHGKGTGALKKAITAKIKNDPRIKSYRPGAYGEGDAGVTVLEIGG